MKIVDDLRIFENLGFFYHFFNRSFISFWQDNRGFITIFLRGLNLEKKTLDFPKYYAKNLRTFCVNFFKGLLIEYRDFLNTFK